MLPYNFLPIALMGLVLSGIVIILLAWAIVMLLKR